MWKIIENHISYIFAKKILNVMKIDFIFEKMQQQKSMSVTLIDRKVVMMQCLQLETLEEKYLNMVLYIFPWIKQDGLFQ